MTSTLMIYGIMLVLSTFIVSASDATSWKQTGVEIIRSNPTELIISYKPKILGYDTSLRDGQKIITPRIKDAAIGERHTGVVPAAIVHVGHYCPFAGAPVEDAGQSGGIAPTIDDQTAIWQQHGTAAEHVVAVVIDLGEDARGGIPNGGIGELCTDWESGALIGGKGQQASIG